ncbi:MAG: hypothetical protein NTW68_02105 [candidate division NC10 bacterium]|nr:hypothetical protein [candidate division NC10 bacterium]
MPEPVGDENDSRREERCHPKVAAHFVDGRILKGLALDFRPSQPTFLFKLRDAADPVEAISIRLADLKALFFVKEFEGDPNYRASTGTDRTSLLEQQVRVRFHDGEVLRGTSPSRDLGGVGFFLIPMDPRSNNRRIYIVTANVAECRIEKGERA